MSDGVPGDDTIRRLSAEQFAREMALQAERDAPRKLVAARYVVERVYFTVACLQVMIGQRKAEEVNALMERCMAEYDRMLQRAADDDGQLAAMSAHTDKQRDYSAECKRIMGDA